MKQPQKTSANNINGALRPVDVYFKMYDAAFSGATQIVLLCLLSALFYLALMGLVWTIPFPVLGFLHSYNGYFNWASFLIAGLMFFWYKQSPLLSYFLLIFIFGISYGVTLIETARPSGLIPNRIIYLAILIATVFGLVKMASKRDINFFKALLYIPLWLVRLIALQLNIKY